MWWMPLHPPHRYLRSHLQRAAASIGTLAFPTVGSCSFSDFAFEGYFRTSCSRSIRLFTLPAAFRGRVVSNTTREGTLNRFSFFEANSITDYSKRSLSGFLKMTAQISSPKRSSGTPITATSMTPGCAARASSISLGDMFSPPLMMRSFLRSVM